MSLAVRDLGMFITSDQELALFEMMCLSGGNTFTYADFVVFVCDPNHADVVRKIRQDIAQVNFYRLFNPLNYLSIKDTSFHSSSCGI